MKASQKRSVHREIMIESIKWRVNLIRYKDKIYKEFVYKLSYSKQAVEEAKKEVRKQTRMYQTIHCQRNTILSVAKGQLYLD